MSKAAELAALIANVNNGSPLGNKNLMQNGAMNVNQREGSTFTTNTYGYGIDGWEVNNYLDDTITISQDSDVPSGQGFGNSMKVTGSSGDSTLTTDEYLSIIPKWEGQNLQHLKKGTSEAVPLTLSFWVKATTTGTYIVEIGDNDNNRQISKAYTVSSSNTWEKKELFIPADTSGTFDDDNSLSLWMHFLIAGAPNLMGGTLNSTWNTAYGGSATNRWVGQVNGMSSGSTDFYLTGVQLEIGEKATAFEYEPYERTLSRCFRYFNRITGSNCREFAGYNESTTKGLHVFRFPVRMRGTPTIGVSSTVSNYIVAYSNTQTACSSTLAFNTTNDEGVTFYSTVASGLTAGGASALRNIDYIDLKAEL